MSPSSLTNTRQCTQCHPATFTHGGRQWRARHATCDRCRGSTLGRPLSTLALPTSHRTSACSRSVQSCWSCSRSFLQHGRAVSSWCTQPYYRLAHGDEPLAHAPEHGQLVDEVLLRDCLWRRQGSRSRPCERGGAGRTEGLLAHLCSSCSSRATSDADVPRSVQ